MIKRSKKCESACAATRPRGRFRINISLDKETYEWVCLIAAKAGVDHTPSGTVAGMVRLVRDIQRAQDMATTDQPSPYGELGDKYASYSGDDLKVPAWKQFTKKFRRHDVSAEA